MKPVGVSEWEPRRWATLANALAFQACWTFAVVILCAIAWR